MAPVPQLWLRLALLATWLAAGWCAFIYLLNRYISQKRKIYPDVRFLAVFFTLTNAVALALGLLARSAWWLVPPLLVLAAAAAWEVNRLRLQRSDSASAPVATQGPPPSLLRPITTTDTRLLFYEIAVPGWRGPAFRIAHISDLHLDDRLPLDYYRDAIARARATHPDLVFFTGDFIGKDQPVALIRDVVSGIRGRYGTYAILGNHDYWVDAPAVTEALREAHICLLGDGCARVQIAPGATLFLCGCQTRWSGPNLALPRPAPGEMGLFLSHSPDNIRALAGAQWGVAAVFAGHYHAGQLRLPGLGALVVPSGLGRRFDHGHFLVDGTHLFVSAGLGAETPPLRVYCQPDIFIVDVKGAEDDGDDRAGPHHSR